MMEAGEYTVLRFTNLVVVKRFYRPIAGYIRLMKFRRKALKRNAKNGGHILLIPQDICIEHLILALQRNPSIFINKGD